MAELLLNNDHSLTQCFKTDDLIAVINYHVYCSASVLFFLFIKLLIVICNYHGNIFILEQSI